jgi:hypothetical protein
MSLNSLRNSAGNSILRVIFAAAGDAVDEGFTPENIAILSRFTPS